MIDDNYRPLLIEAMFARLRGDESWWGHFTLEQREHILIGFKKFVVDLCEYEFCDLDAEEVIIRMTLRSFTNMHPKRSRGNNERLTDSPE